MAKKRTDAKQAKESIITAAQDLIRRRGAAGITVDQVATHAGCAKGLIHYHFKTKRGLLEAVAAHLSTRRRDSWVAAFSAASPKAAIDQTWGLLTTESDNGTILAWSSMFGPGSPVPDQTVSNALREFGSALGEAAHRMLRDLGSVPRIPPSEIGWLLGAVVHGMGFQLLSGADRAELEGAYAAAWLGILSPAG
jgi:AcrR family transcriptional regulator